MEKRVWTMPQAEVDKFEVNDNITACYVIDCNVGTGFGYIEQNDTPGYQNGDVKLTNNGVHGCGDEHVGVYLDAAPYENAMWQPQSYSWGRYVNDGDPYGVFYWSTGSGSNNQHFSKVSDAKWETNPNAS